MNSERTMASVYLEWAKQHARARFDLAASGVAEYRVADLQVRLENLELSGPDLYGYEPLIEQLAARYAVPAESVVTATGFPGRSGTVFKFIRKKWGGRSGRARG